METDRLLSKPTGTRSRPKISIRPQHQNSRLSREYEPEEPKYVAGRFTSLFEEIRGSVCEFSLFSRCILREVKCLFPSTLIDMLSYSR